MPNLIRVDEEYILSIEPPERQGEPYRISAKFYDDNGNLLFQIVRNEWIGLASNWDIECVGRRITIKKKPREISLQIACTPPQGIVIEKLNMFYNGVRIFTNGYYLCVVGRNRSRLNIIGREIINVGGSEGCFCSVEKDDSFYVGGIDGGPFIVDNLREEPPLLPKSVKIGRNSNCPCGSGLKYKKCCELLLLRGR